MGRTSKKTYVSTARHIHALKTAIAINVPDSYASQEAVLLFAESMASDFTASHHDSGYGPFNPVRFMAACGYEGWTPEDEDGTAPPDQTGTVETTNAGFTAWQSGSKPEGGR
jgi:hypothetical protein